MNGKSLSYLVAGAVLSVLVLIMFMGLKVATPTAMSLEVHWIVYSILPLVLFLFAGGVINVFKGFGVEIGLKLDETVQQHLPNLLETKLDRRMLLDVGRFRKGPRRELDMLDAETANKTRILTILVGRNHTRYDLQVLWSTCVHFQICSSSN